MGHIDINLRLDTALSAKNKVILVYASSKSLLKLAGEKTDMKEIQGNHGL